MTALVGVVDGIACALPQLGSKSYLYAYLMDDAGDYRSSLNGINAFSAIEADSSQGCPGVTPGHTGVSGWSNNQFPATTGQVLECKLVGPASNVPQYVWTVPSENVILKATGHPGSSMNRLDAWWSKNADT